MWEISNVSGGHTVAIWRICFQKYIAGVQVCLGINGEWVVYFRIWNIQIKKGHYSYANH